MAAAAPTLTYSCGTATGGRQPCDGTGGHVSAGDSRTDGSVLRRLRLNLLGYSTGNASDAQTTAANVVHKLCQHAMI